jgi:hypothetical protein
MLGRPCSFCDQVDETDRNMLQEERNGIARLKKRLGSSSNAGDGAFGFSLINVTDALIKEAGAAATKDGEASMPANRHAQRGAGSAQREDPQHAPDAIADAPAPTPSPTT